MQDAVPRWELSGIPSYHRENKFHLYDVHFSNWSSLVAQVSSSILLSSHVL